MGCGLFRSRAPYCKVSISVSAGRWTPRIHIETLPGPLYFARLGFYAHTTAGRIAITAGAVDASLRRATTRAHYEGYERFDILTSAATVMVLGNTNPPGSTVISPREFAGAFHGDEADLFWIEAREFPAIHRTVLLPADAVIPPLLERRSEPWFDPPFDATGTASHVRRERAIQHALAEIVERDAVYRFWQQIGPGEAHRITEPRSPVSKATHTFLKLRGCSIELVLLSRPPSDELTVLAVLLDRHGGCCLGAASATSISAAAERAAHEAIALSHTIRECIHRNPDVRGIHPSMLNALRIYAMGTAVNDFIAHRLIARRYSAQDAPRRFYIYVCEPRYRRHTVRAIAPWMLRKPRPLRSELGTRPRDILQQRYEIALLSPIS